MDNDILASSTTGVHTEPLKMSDIKKAIQMLGEMSKKPLLTSIKSRHDWYETIEKSPLARDFLYHGTPVYKDDSIPDGIIRFVMSDGSFTDCPYVNKLSVEEVLR